MKISALRKISLEVSVGFIISGINLRISRDSNEIEVDNISFKKKKQYCLIPVKTVLRDVPKKLLIES